MKIVGCDLHTRYQQIAMLEEETGELVERRLEHESGEARAGVLRGLGGAGAGGDRSHRTHATGSNGCWPSWDTSSGSGTRPRSGRRWCANRRRMRATRRTCWSCAERAFSAAMAAHDGRA
jgi:hypothetical protein